MLFFTQLYKIEQLFGLIHVKTPSTHAALISETVTIPKHTQKTIIFLCYTATFTWGPYVRPPPAG